jgi:AcrR family transcriptional regulator
VILDAAAQVLLRDGYERTSTNRIAQRAGVSVGSLYRYFSSKDEILLALLGREIEHLIQHIVSETSDRSDATVQESLARLARASIRGWRYEPRLYRELERVPRAERVALTRKAYELLQEHLYWLLKRHALEIAHRDLRSAAFVLVNSASGLTASTDERFFREQGADELFRLFSGYLLTESPDSAGS